MSKFFTNTYPSINLHKKASNKSEIVTQMIYGDSFSVLARASRWLKVKIKEDKYIGFVRIKNFSNLIKPNYKISVLKASIYKLPNNRKKIGELTFGSKILVSGASSIALFLFIIISNCLKL